MTDTLVRSLSERLRTTADQLAARMLESPPQSGDDADALDDLIEAFELLIEAADMIETAATEDAP